MSKTMSEQSTTEVAIAAQEDPRAIMKLVRSEVKMAVEGGHRVDLMGYNGPDIARSQIALQDLLDKERTKHKKATDHIVTFRQLVTHMDDAFCVVFDGLVDQSAALQQQLNDLQNAYNELVRKNSSIHCERMSFQKAFIDSLDEKEVLQKRLDAALNAMTALNDRTAHG